MPNLLDLMTPEDRKTVEGWAVDRLNPQHKQDIPPYFYLCAQLGYYYGWQAVVDFKRNYHSGIDSKGNLTRLAFVLEEAVALVKAAEKLHYRLNIDSGKINAATTLSTNDKSYAKHNAEYVNKLQDEAYK